MSSPIPLFINLPGQPSAPMPQGAVPVQMAYRLGPGPQLLAAPGAAALVGGRMMVDHPPLLPRLAGDPGRLCSQVLSLCRRQGYSGVLMNWTAPPSPELNALTLRLDAALRAAGLKSYVPHLWGDLLPEAALLLPAALSGGCFRESLAERMATFGPRIVPMLHLWAQLFTLPDSEGRGIAMSQAQLSRLQGTLHPKIYHCPRLCANYFTWQEGDKAKLVLFEDRETLREKRNILEELGVEEWVGVFSQIP